MTSGVEGAAGAQAPAQGGGPSGAGSAGAPAPERGGGAAQAPGQGGAAAPARDRTRARVPDHVRWTSGDVATARARAAAFVVDAGTFATLWAAGMIILVETGELGVPPDLGMPRAWVWAVVVWALSLLYDAASLHQFGSTIGRRIAGIEVRADNGALPGPGAGLSRALVRTPAVLLGGAGLLSLRTDRQRRALHDRIAGTVVVRSSQVEAVDAGAGGLVSTEAAGQVDADEAAIRRARLPAAQASWLRAVAQQAPVRLDLADPAWRAAADPAAVVQRTTCLLLARLSARYPEQLDTITRVLDRHDALSGVPGDRQRYLAGLLDDPPRARAWLGLSEDADLRAVLDDPGPR